jgi:hypothetical protein
VVETTGGPQRSNIRRQHRRKTADGSVRYQFQIGVEAASVLKYRVAATNLELIDGNPNTAAGAGGSLHVSPDGTKYAMVAGGGWQSLKDPTRRHNIAVFSTELYEIAA